MGEALALAARRGLSFGGPAGQIAVMHRILVEEKRWIGETRFLHALNYCMLLPGPEAHELAIYIGWLMHRMRGGILAGVLFVLPGFVVLMALSWLYAALRTCRRRAVAVLRADGGSARGGARSGDAGRQARAQDQRVVRNRGAAFIGIFFFALPFPLIILAAALTAFAATRWPTGIHARRGARQSENRARTTTPAWRGVAGLKPVLDVPACRRGRRDLARPACARAR